MDDLDAIRRILVHRDHRDLADLLARARLEVDVSSQYGSYWNSFVATAEFYAPIEDCDVLRTLGDSARGIILDAVQEIHPPRDNDMEVRYIDFLVDPEAPTAEVHAARGSASPLDARPYWRANHLRLFLSHVHAHKALARQVQQQLQYRYVSTFVAHVDIEPTAEWLGEIEHALASCDVLAAFLTEDFHASPWTDQEVGFAVCRQIPVIPIMLGVQPYGFIARYQSMRPQEGTPYLIGLGICRALLSNDATASKMSEALCRALVEADSYEAARRCAELLPHVRSVSPGIVDQVKGAPDANRQVGEAHGVPWKIERFVGRMGRAS